MAILEKYRHNVVNKLSTNRKISEMIKMIMYCTLYTEYIRKNFRA